MLLRLTILAPFEVRERMLRILANTDALIDTLPARGEFESAARSECDVLLIERTALGRSARSRLAQLRGANPPIDAIVLTHQEDAPDRADLLAAGALAIVNVDLPETTVRATLDALLARRRDASLHRLRADRGDRRASLDDFASESPAMQRLLNMARRVVEADTSLLILGETGVGKERFARALHDEGPRHAGPFVAVNCGAMTETLLESELFGHEEGAFTGASRPRRGFFELAHGGTLLLDEIGEMSPSLQVRVLRALQERKVMRVGGEREIEVDVRVIAATHRDLVGEMQRGSFRADLYYRIGVVTLTIPPLRERATDIPTIVKSHLLRIAARTNKRSLSISPGALERLLAYSWPGNVRELLNVLERAALLADGEEIAEQQLPEEISGRSRLGGDGSEAKNTLRIEALEQLPMTAAVERLVTQFERNYLTTLLRTCRGRIGEAAARAGISERTLFSKMRRYALDKSDFR
jgi:DNA-binding NtrC family response regulator